ncbi:hypothetical protein ACWIE6_08290 [Paenibacillus taichungensis]|uniref:hypothetical protein n=1 Tax=Paenibacillus taichungensis TaxID=484184 RepID=UPI0035D79CC8
MKKRIQNGRKTDASFHAIIYKRSQFGQEQITNMQDSHPTIGIQGNECMIAVSEHQ